MPETYYVSVKVEELTERLVNIATVSRADVQKDGSVQLHFAGGKEITIAADQAKLVIRAIKQKIVAGIDRG